MKPREIFSKRLLFAILLLGAASMIAGVVLSIVFQPREQVDSAGNDSFSRAAVGHHALYELLERLDGDLERSRYKTAARSQRASLLLIIEPLSQNPKIDDDEAHKQHLARMLDAAPRSLLALPHWKGSPAPGPHRWVGSVKPYSQSQASDLLWRLEPDLTLIREDAPLTNNWSSAEGLPTVQLKLPRPQLLRGTGITPLIWHEKGVLFGKLEHPSMGREVYLLSDPDLLANHGLKHPEHAALVAAMIRQAKQGQRGPLLLDEILHGWELPPSLLRELFRFPLLLATIQLILLFLLAIWSGLGRFGRPRPPGADIARDKDHFVSNTAALLGYGGHDAHSVELYLWQSIHQVARGLNAPKALLDDDNRQELISWLEEAAERRIGRPYGLRSIASRAESYAVKERRASRRKLLKLAEQIDQWKRELLHGS